MSTDTDHRVNIFDAFAGRTEDLIHEREDGDLDSFLDVTIWRAADREPRVEFLLSCGGPTERVFVDCGYETVEFHHSWGMVEADDGTPIDRTVLDAWGDEKDVWADTARDFAEWMA